MIPLDICDETILCSEQARFFLSEEEWNEFNSFDNQTKLTQFKNLLEKPIVQFTSLNELYFRSKWANLITTIHQNKPITLLEVASGDADMIPQAISRSNPKTTYITANMNQGLNKSLLKKTEGLDITLQLIDDDAMYIEKYVPVESVDIIAFQHGVNDVLQGILCGKYGIDTIYTDWMECLPKMIELLNIEIENQSFEDSVKKPFLNLIQNLSTILKKDGIIAINHYMFQLDLDWGYPKDLFENLVPLIRKWFKQFAFYEEIFFTEFNPQWWLFLKRK